MTPALLSQRQGRKDVALRKDQIAAVKVCYMFESLSELRNAAWTCVKGNSVVWVVEGLHHCSSDCPLLRDQPHEK